MTFLKKILLSLAGLATLLPMEASAQKLETATFAGGCFWCMTPPFENLKDQGVLQVLCGYTGGQGNNPTYEDYAEKGHYEAVQVSYDPSKISYQKLLDVFWRNIDPTDENGQFVDRGHQYRTAVFYHNAKQKELAEKSKAALAKSGKFDKPIATKILAASVFYKAEDYHQDYYKKNPLHYKLYHDQSGRNEYLNKVWGQTKEGSMLPKEKGQNQTQIYSKPSQEELKKRLNSLQYEVTQEEGTEPPFRNEFWNNHRDGIYVDVVSGEPLFSSKDKFDSGTGWPSFTQPLEKQNVQEKTDNSYFMSRTEVRSAHANSHLGHVFDDGPKPTGLRYCINSAALRFVPKEDLDKEGYGQYKKLFE